MAQPKRNKPIPMRKVAAKQTSANLGEMQTLRFTRKNRVLFGIGILSILLGFGLLGLKDITLAPILLVAGYLVFVPWSLIAQRGASKAPAEGEPAEK